MNEPRPFWSRLSSRKFLVAVVTAVLALARDTFGIPDEAMQYVVGLAITYIGGEAAVDIFKRAPQLILIAVLPLVCFTGCYRSNAAQNVNAAMEASAISYQKNMERVLEGFITDYRTQAQAKADELAADAIKAEVDPLTGKASAKNLQIILEKKVEQYALIEQRIVDMRKKIIAANVDIDHLLQYSASLKEYFKQRNNAAELLNQSSETTVKLLDQFVKAKPK